MAVPKTRTSHSKRNMRRSHHALESKNFALCSNCGAPKFSHSVCESCGFYNGRFLDKKYLKSKLLLS